MRDLNTLRRRLFVAMGVVSLGAASACGSDSGGPSGPADTSATDVVATVDSAGGGDADAAGSDTGAADAAPADAAVDILGPDGGVGDGGVGDGGVGDGGVGDGGATDTLAGDTGSPDANTGDTGSPDTTAGDTGAFDAGVQPTCSNGQPSTQCFTAKQLKYNVDLAFMKGGPIPDDKVDFPLPPEGCPPPERVYEGCCNKAVTGPVLAGDTCCYGFCVGACCGRPLRVDGASRLAPAVARADWYGTPSVPAARASATLDPVTRAAVTSAWREDGRMEHASVASFNQFSLQLLALGAPATLVHGAQRAALDEVDHAERCFGVVAVVSGAAEGPGPLALAGMRASASLVDAAAAAAVEGCVGETLAALLAGARARGAQVDAVRANLETIAADEARHAELSWRFVRWALDQGGEPVRAALRQAFLSALAEPPAPRMPRGVSLDDWRAWGLLDPTTHRRTVDAGLRHVLGPCVDALLGEPVWQQLDRCAPTAQLGARQEPGVASPVKA